MRAAKIIPPEGKIKGGDQSFDDKAHSRSVKRSTLLKLSDAEGVHSRPSWTVSRLPSREARMLWSVFVGLGRWIKLNDRVNLLSIRR